jgi:hypothetical protein
MIVVKKLSGRGVGNLKNPSSVVGAVVPPVLGGALAIAGAYGMDMLGTPKEGEAATETQLFLQEWSAALGIAIGAAGSLAMYAMVGAPQGVSALAGAVVGGGALVVKKMIDTSKATKGYYRGYGAVVPQRSNMGAIVLSPVAGTRGMRGLRGSYQASGPSAGEVVTLGAINQSAFGTPGFLQGRR